MKFLIKVFFTVCLVLYSLILLTEFLSPRDDLVPADVIVAISGGDTSARANYAIDLFDEGYADKLIFSGDALDPLSPSNAEVMGRVATLRGVPSANIYLSQEAKNTEENAQETKDIIEDSGYKTVILVTSEYHQRRAFIEFSDKLGDDVEIINSPVVEKGWSKRLWWTTPRGWFLTVSETVKIPIAFVRNLLN